MDRSEKDKMVQRLNSEVDELKIGLAGSLKVRDVLDRETKNLKKKLKVVEGSIAGKIEDAKIPLTAKINSLNKELEVIEKSRDDKNKVIQRLNLELDGVRQHRAKVENELVQKHEAELTSLRNERDGAIRIVEETAKEEKESELTNLRSKLIQEKENELQSQKETIESDLQGKHSLEVEELTSNFKRQLDVQVKNS